MPMSNKSPRTLGAGVLAIALACGAAFAADRVNERTIRVRGAQVSLWNPARLGADDAVSYSISLPNGGSTIVERADYSLGLPLLQGDPMARAADAPAPLMTGGAGVYIVQFHTQPIDEYLKDVEAAGATVYQYMANYAYAMKLDDDALAAVRALPFVRWVGEFQPAYKLDGDLLLRDHAIDVGPQFRAHTEGFNAARGAGDAPTPVTIMVFERGERLKSAVAARVAAIGGAVTDLGPDGFLLRADLTADQIADIARMPEVQRIEPWAPGGHDMNNGRIVSGANVLSAQTAPPNPATGYNGEGVRAEIADTETLVSHLDFQVNPIIVHLAGSVPPLHGTSCMGINFGTGVANASARGFLPAGQGIFAQSQSLINGSAFRYTHTAQLLGAPYFAVFQTNSTGAGVTTAYTSISAQMDDILFQNEVLHFQSQSNQNTQLSRPQAWAKNIVAVGALNHFNNTLMSDDTWNGASIGYAADGRVKPDLAFWYDNILTTDGTSTVSYTNFGGTSGATPMTAGTTGLFFQMWHHGIFGNPTAATVFDSRPRMSLAKAMMINTARQWDYTTWSTGQTEPNRSRRKQGWGMPNVENIYNLRNNMFWVNETDILENLQTRTYRVRVAEGSTTPFKATMVYIDPQGNPNVPAQHRVNDLTLKVTDPNGVVYWGNYGLGNQNPASGGSGAPSEGMWSLPGGSPNTKDTVENVFVQTAPAGTWIVEVIAAELVQDAWPRPAVSGPIDASFSLVVTGAVVASCPGDTNGDNLVNFADLNACLSHFGVVSGATTAQGDVDGDGDVDFADLNIILSNFGNVC